MSERKVDGWIDDIVGALFDPIIVMPGGWGDDLPEWLRTRVTLERLGENIVALREGRGLTATDAEAACYLFTASLTAPMGSDWTQIYLYVAGGEMKSEKKLEMPDDIKVESLTESQWRDLKQLKDWIYGQRLKHRKEKQRGERRQAKEEAAAKELETRAVQPSFF
ncbi:unnamed protein product [marine sediment metagenome]|uniref:Uncharacterized protein n=1 Tax=marine sediment metagenome TaxID=412755 RepID=X1R3X7_9ZZZZ